MPPDEHRHRLLRVGRRQRHHRDRARQGAGARGHDVHILSSDTPVRLGDYQPGLSFHRVETPSYPLFREPQYLLSLANKIVQVSRARAARHRARALRDPARDGGVPGAADPGGDASGPRAARSSRRCTAPTSRCSAAIRRTRRPWRSASSSPTASRPCRRASRRTRTASSASARDIRVIPNFLDCAAHRRVETSAALARGCRRRRREAPDPRVELPAGEAGDGRRRGVRARPPRSARAAADGGRRPRSRRSVAAGRARWASTTTSTSSASRIRWCRCCRLPTCSCCRRRRRASGWRRSRPWPARCRSSPRASAGCRRSIDDGVNGFLHAAGRPRRHGAVDAAAVDRRGAAPAGGGRSARETVRTSGSATRRSCPLYEALLRGSAAARRVTPDAARLADSVRLFRPPL